MGDYEAKAREAVKKADKKLSGFGFFGNKYEDAAELLERAGNQFKLAKAWMEGGQTFEKLAQVHLKLESKHEAASTYVEAAKCYQKCSKSDALRALHKAIDYYTEIGRLGMAAKQLRDVAETQEKQGMKEEAVEFYLQAANLFQTEDSTAEANKCRLKVAQFAAELERYPQAIEIYEDIARTSVENNLLKFSAKGYLLCAGICQLATLNDIAISTALERYQDIDIAFQGSREEKLLRELAEAVEAADVQKFTDAIAEFDSMTRLDPWKTTILLRVKKGMAAKEDAEEDLT
ncbi:hypothetical protein WJX72_011368 [[Myrmecia] bisecta]|uniref:Alpha-soluble NSF attachment protein n=1 Tax=[Myrmecia] bisecta TaxID=41462 RepID=A0AAW1PA27_9CHLO